MIRLRLERRQETPLYLQILIPIARGDRDALLLRRARLARRRRSSVEAYRLLLFSTFARATTCRTRW